MRKSNGRPPPETQVYMGQVGGILVPMSCSPSSSRPTRPCPGSSQIPIIASIPYVSPSSFQLGRGP
ncbi:hypothetical protein FIBSPDRAFT_871654 [Athelia psychrophila]|uniref:Uncharacterized protein n=1 Tax=Athelia psychrophila TaxID=1759441 RepID=A0A166A9M6_9AGAM|nr:hypothetical protein FIBSPDRAFT_871654 [Fibularhizoctonia sp. CBS 109695]